MEHDQRDEIHLKVYSTVLSTRYTALTENGEGFFFCVGFVVFLSSRLGSTQYSSHCSYCQLSKVGGITTSTGENNTLCFIGALWVCAEKPRDVANASP